MCILNTLPVSPSFFKNGRQNFMMQQFGTFIYCNETNLDNKFKRACFQLIKNKQQKHFIRDMRNPGFVCNSGLPEERSWPHACACFPTYEPTLGPNPIQPGAQTNQSVLDF